MWTLLLSPALAQVPCTPPQADAGSITIPVDFPSLDAAVAAMGSALDRHTIYLQPGVHQTQATFAGIDVSIVGLGGDCHATELYGTVPAALTFLNSTSDIHNVVFRGEDPSRGVSMTESTVTMQDTCFVGLGQGASPAITEGAAIHATDSDLCMVSSRVEGSVAERGAGLLAIGSDENFVYLENTVFKANQATGGDGGGAHVTRPPGLRQQPGRHHGGWPAGAPRRAPGDRGDLGEPQRRPRRRHRGRHDERDLQREHVHE